MMSRRGLGSLFCVEGTIFAYLIEKEYATTDDLITKFFELQEMLSFANAAVALVTTQKGALRVMPTEEEI